MVLSWYNVLYDSTITYNYCIHLIGVANYRSV